jgi:predicted nucleic acid-binding protein
MSGSMPILVDATVLSNLAAVDRLDLLTLLRDTLYLASTVYEEIQQGLEEGYAFLANVDRALDAGLFSLVTL